MKLLNVIISIIKEELDDVLPSIIGLDMYAFSTNVKDELKALYGAVRRSEHYAVHEIKEV